MITTLPPKVLLITIYVKRRDSYEVVVIANTRFLSFALLKAFSHLCSHAMIVYLFVDHKIFEFCPFCKLSLTCVHTCAKRKQ